VKLSSKNFMEVKSLLNKCILRHKTIGLKGIKLCQTFLFLLNVRATTRNNTSRRETKIAQYSLDHVVASACTSFVFKIRYGKTFFFSTVGITVFSRRDSVANSVSPKISCFSFFLRGCAVTYRVCDTLRQ